MGKFTQFKNAIIVLPSYTSRADKTMLSWLPVASTLAHFYLHKVLRELSFFTGRGGPSVCGGGPEFFGVVQGGDQFFFSRPKGGTRIF